LLGGLLVGLNTAADRLFARFDWTADNRYSLSPASRALVRDLPDPVVVKYVRSPALPEPYETQSRYIRDVLNEFRTASRDRWTIETVTPDKSDASVADIARLGLQSARFTQMASDQFQVREGFLGLVLFYQDKQDVIPFVKDVNNLEYEIASRLRVMSQKKKKNLFFVSNHNEVSPQHMRQGPAARLFDEFHVEPTRLSLKDDPGLWPDAVFLLGPQNKLNDDELDALDRYISSGVPVVVALNRRVVMPNGFRSLAQDTGLEPFLTHYGVNVDRDFVLDERCQNIVMQTRENAFYVSYWPFIMANDLNKNHIAVRSLDVLSFPYANAVSPSFGDGAPLTFTPLARSSGKSWVWEGAYNMDPPSLLSQRQSQTPTRRGPFTLAAVVEGSTTTFRAPRGPVPNLRLVVLGTSYFANPQFPLPEGNPLFILALAQWLTQDGPSLAMPPKSSPYRPLKILPPALRVLTKAVGYVLIPVLIVLAGVLHWRHRRAVRLDVVRWVNREGPRA
jgi:ABC-type uncharacterized transport system involved in gliding motility auxiliary subunit